MTYLPIKVPTSYLIWRRTAVWSKDNTMCISDIFYPLCIFERGLLSGSYGVEVEGRKGGIFAIKVATSCYSSHVMYTLATPGVAVLQIRHPFPLHLPSLCLEHLFPNCLLQTFYLSFRLEASLIYPSWGGGFSSALQQTIGVY